MVVESSREKRFDGFARAMVEHSTTFSQQQVIRDLPRERVLESVLGVVQRRLLVNKLRRLKTAQQTIEMVGLELHDLADQRKLELGTDHRLG